MKDRVDAGSLSRRFRSGPEGIDDEKDSSPEAVDDSLQEVLDRMARSERVTFAPGTRFRFLKRMALRVLRPLTFQQEVFNRLTLDALDKLHRKQRLLERRLIEAERLLHEVGGPNREHEGLVLDGRKGLGPAVRHLSGNPSDRLAPGRLAKQRVRIYHDLDTSRPEPRGLLSGSSARLALKGRRLALVSPNLVPHDAVSNILVDRCRMLEDWGVEFGLHIGGSPQRDEFSDHLRTSRHPDSSFDLWWFDYPGYYPLLEEIRDESKGPKIFDYHGVTPPELEPLRDLQVDLDRTGLAREADSVFVHSRFLEEELIRDHGVDPAKVHRFPYGVDVDGFRPRIPDPLIERLYGLSGKKVLLYVGRMAANKRIDVLVRGLSHLPSDYVLMLVGNTDEPRYGEEVRRTRMLSDRLGVASRLTFTGRVSDAELRAIYPCADLLVSASLHEGFGIPFVEAMAGGIPAVATRATAIPEVIGNAGRTFQAEDSSDFADKVRSLLEDETAYLECVENGLRRARSFSREALQDSLLEILPAILSEARA